MKKTICTILALGALAQTAAYAEEMPLLTASGAAKDYSIVIGDTELNTGENKAYATEKNIMLPLRQTAEKLGFKVEWDNKSKAVSLDDGSVNTKLYIGMDNYYMASSVAIGMSTPTSLGDAPIVTNDVTYVPAKLFDILYCGNVVTVKDNKVTIKTEDKANNLQIPNPIEEYKTVEEAEKAVNFEVKQPSKLPQGYKLTFISTISNETFQLVYSDGENEITFRMAKGSEDISGDYNIYKNTKSVENGDLKVTYKGNGDISNAVWTDKEFAYSIYADKAVSENVMTDIVSNVK